MSNGGGYGGSQGGFGSSGAYTPRGGFQYQPQTGGMSPTPQTQAPTDGSRFGFGPYGVQDNQTGEFYGGPRNRRFGEPPRNYDPNGRFGFGPNGVQDRQTGEFYGGPRNRRFGPPPAYQNAYGVGGFTGQGFTGQDTQPAFDPQQDSAPGFMVNQRAQGAIDPGRNMISQAPQQPQQSFEQFAQTLNGSGMTSGQMQDAYQKSLQPQSTNFWANTGVGTQRPNGFQTPDNWGQQTYGFDPRAMAGKQVGADMAWYYGRDAIGRNINNQGDAVAGFTGPADGFQRRRPWM